jgi:class 3 adenylate cyclase
LNSYAYFFDNLAATVKTRGGIIVTYLGDGVMAVFSEGLAANAISWAIQAQEALADDREARRRRGLLV